MVTVYAEQVRDLSGSGNGDVETVSIWMAETLSFELQNETWVAGEEVCDVNTIVTKTVAPSPTPTTARPSSATPSCENGVLYVVCLFYSGPR